MVNAAMNIHVHGFVCTDVFISPRARSGIARQKSFLHGESIHIFKAGRF